MTYLHGTKAYWVIALLVNLWLTPNDCHHVRLFKIKHKISGQEDRCKAHIVARGFQQARFDYFKTFVHIVKWETIWIVNGLARHCGWPIHHLNVQTMFLNGVFYEEMYMVQLDGLATLSTKHLVCQLHCMLYGLKQIHHVWYFIMDSTLFQVGLIKNGAGSNIYYHRTTNLIIISLWMTNKE
jgi:hypothetical protein